MTATAIEYRGEGRTVMCPKCGAEIYKACRTPSGRKLKQAHAARVAKFENVRIRGGLLARRNQTMEERP